MITTTAAELASVPHQGSTFVAFSTNMAIISSATMAKMRSDFRIDTSLLSYADARRRSSSESSSNYPFYATAKSSGGEKPKLYRGVGLGWAYDTIQPGAAVTVIGGTSDIYWFKVTVDGRTGYMPGKYLSR